METKTLLRLTLWSHLKLMGFSFLAFGVIMGMVMFFLSFFDPTVYADLGPWHFTGVSAGVAGLFMGPFTFWLVGLIFALVTFWPLRLFLRFADGLKLTGIWR